MPPLCKHHQMTSQVKYIVYKKIRIPDINLLLPCELWRNGKHDVRVWMHHNTLNGATMKKIQGTRKKLQYYSENRVQDKSLILK
jgi:hypothetical protein